MTGADSIVESLIDNGIDRIFVFPGGTIAPVLDSAVKRGIEIICSRHEQGAGYAALAAARLTRRPHVVMVTSGPGVTNLATVIADAYFDSTPLIALAGQIGTGDLASQRNVRQLGFQHVDAVSLMRPISKATFLPLSPADLPFMMEEAFFAAQEGRPGPVVVDLPMDVQRGILEASKGRAGNLGCASGRLEPGHELITKMAEWLLGARKPVILAGQGVLLSDSCSELRTLALRYRIPVAMSLLGLGAFPTKSPLALGFPGHTGSLSANRAIHGADLLLAIGTRLDVRQTGTCTQEFVPNGRVVRIDLDRGELIHSRVRTDLNIQGDAKLTLNLLMKRLEGQPAPDTSEWRSQISEWQSKFPLCYDAGSSALKPQHVIETVNRLTKNKRVIVVSGVGSHQQWSARHFDFDFPARAWLTSGGHGAMGYDLPTAIGAQLARPTDLVVCFVGDGSFQLNIQELQSAVVYRTPIKIFVLDNQRLALVSQFQMMNWGSDPTTGNKQNPDFAAIAEGYGIKAYTIKKASDIETVASTALAVDGPVLVHCLVDPAEDVTPMLLPAQTMDRMWPYES